MKTRNIILVVLTSILMFVLGGLVVYQVVSPKENKEESVPNNKVENEKSSITDISLGGYSKYENYVYINDKPTKNLCGSNFTLQSDISYRIFNNYVYLYYWCGGTGSSRAIYDMDANELLRYSSFDYQEYTETGVIVGYTKKDSNGDKYWEETTVDLSGDKANIKTTKEKINVDCKIYGGDAYDKLSEKDQKKYYECCDSCL